MISETIDLILQRSIAQHALVLSIELGAGLITYVALLHSIILNEGRRVVMSDLRRIAEAAGFQNPRTLVATGNLLVDSKDKVAVSKVEQRLESGIAETYGKHIDVIVRTKQDWRRLVADNPFVEESEQDGSLVVVRVMREPLFNNTVTKLEPSRTDPEKIELVNGNLWLSFVERPNKSRLLSQLTVKKMGVGTVRNWNTVRGVADILDR